MLKLETPIALTLPALKRASMALYVAVRDVSVSLKIPVSGSRGKYLSPAGKSLKQRSTKVKLILHYRK